MLRRPFTFKRSDRDFDYPLPQSPPPARPPIRPFRRPGTGWTLGLVRKYPVRRVLTQSACTALVWQHVRMLAAEGTSTTRTVPRWLIRREIAAGIVGALCRRGQNTDHSGARPGRLPPLRLGRYYAAAPDCSDICQMDFFGPADKHPYNTGKSRGEQAPYETHTPDFLGRSMLVGSRRQARVELPGCGSCRRDRFQYRKSVPGAAGGIRGSPAAEGSGEPPPIRDKIGCHAARNPYLCSHLQRRGPGGPGLSLGPNRPSERCFCQAGLPFIRRNNSN